MSITISDVPITTTLAGTQDENLVITEEQVFASDTDTGYTITTIEGAGTVSYEVQRETNGSFVADDRFKVADGKLQIVANSTFDFEDVGGTLTLRVVATDDNATSTTATATLSVVDVPFSTKTRPYLPTATRGLQLRPTKPLVM